MYSRFTNAQASILPSRMDDWEWKPGDPKMIGVLTEYDPAIKRSYPLSSITQYRPPHGRSFRGELPYKRYVYTRCDDILNEGPYARSPAYIFRMLLSSGPDPLHIGPTALDIYKGSLPFRSKEAVEQDMILAGGRDEGLTSIRACARFLYFSGYIDSYVWSVDVNDMLRWLSRGSGPLAVEMPVHQDFTYDDCAWLELEGPIIGRDCFLLTSYIYGTGYVRFASAYGRGWGPDNHKRMHLDVFQKFSAENLVIACGVVGKHAGIEAARLRDEREEDMELILDQCVGETLSIGNEGNDGYYQDLTPDTRWPESGPDEADWELPYDY